MNDLRVAARELRRAPLVTAIAIAAWLPAYRGSRLDPATVLRES